jgi:hypothetical protein
MTRKDYILTIAATDHIGEWAAFCASLGASFETFTKGVDEFMSDPSWVDAGWQRLLNAVEQS